MDVPLAKRKTNLLASAGGAKILMFLTNDPRKITKPVSKVTPRVIELRSHTRTLDTRVMIFSLARRSSTFRLKIGSRDTRLHCSARLL